MGFGGAVTPKPKLAEFPTLLDFPAPRWKVYPKETVAAEKFEAMVRFGEANGRMKDFWDVIICLKNSNSTGGSFKPHSVRRLKIAQTPFPTVLPIALKNEFAENPNGRGSMECVHHSKSDRTLVRPFGNRSTTSSFLRTNYRSRRRQKSLFDELEARDGVGHRYDYPNERFSVDGGRMVAVLNNA